MEHTRPANSKIVAATKSVCPRCLRPVDGNIVFRDGLVFLIKFCPDHGEFEVPVYADANAYAEAVADIAPGAEPLRYLSEVVAGCPDDCGICPAHEQHTCVGVIEITDFCNLSCPVCFAGAGGRFMLPLERVKEMIDTFLKCEDQPEVLQISGGEPTLHPDIFDILGYASGRGIKYLLLNTNGVRLADKDFARALAGALKHRAGGAKPVIYLQFDGFSDDAYRVLRGRALLDIKMRALANCREFGINVALVPTIVRGVNAVIYLSRIFKWYSKDFGSDSESVLKFIASYHREGGFILRNMRKLRVSYLPYDWSLNKKDRRA